MNYLRNRYALLNFTYTKKINSLMMTDAAAVADGRTIYLRGAALGQRDVVSSLRAKTRAADIDSEPRTKMTESSVIKLHELADELLHARVDA